MLGEFPERLHVEHNTQGINNGRVIPTTPWEVICLRVYVCVCARMYVCMALEKDDLVTRLLVHIGCVARHLTMVRYRGAPDSRTFAQRKKF